MLENIFSIQNQAGRKVINILGIKFKFSNPKFQMMQQALISNKNTVQIVYCLLESASDDDLFCLRTGDMTFIVHRNCLNLDYKFFQDYLLPFGYAHNILEFIKLDRTSLLYREHIDRVLNGEFLWKYIERGYYIGHNFISTDKITGEIYINTSYVPEENLAKGGLKVQHVPQIAKRKYIKGEAVGEYLKNKTFEERQHVVESLLEYLFTTYRDPNDSEKVSGDLLDCHLYNFLIGEDGQFYFIDFDLECSEPLERNYCIFFMLFYYDKTLYKMMLEKYGFSDRHKYWQKNFSVDKQPASKNEKKLITPEHASFCRKYFSDQGTDKNYTIQV